MTTYTTLDPFQANYYGDRIQSQATGDFAKMFKEKINEILVRVARAEPTQGTVVEAGVQKWYDDGSADVLLATKISNKTPDGKTVESGDRWVVTAKKEGQLWKISQPDSGDLTTDAAPAPSTSTPRSRHRMPRGKERRALKTETPEPEAPPEADETATADEPTEAAAEEPGQSPPKRRRKPPN